MATRKRLRAVANAASRNGYGPIVDPTVNVLDKVDDAVSRLNDLMAAGEKYLIGMLTEKTERIDATQDLHTSYREKLMAAESRRVDEESALRADYEEKLRQAEAKRIDAIRAVDVGAVATASERAAQQANVLATQLQQSTETLRTGAATTATAVAQQLQNNIQPLVDRISNLEKAQYESKGKSGVSDPQLEKLTDVVAQLAKSSSEGSGKGHGVTQLWAVIGGLIILGLMVWNTFKPAPPPVYAPQPQPARSAQ